MSAKKSRAQKASSDPVLRPKKAARPVNAARAQQALLEAQEKLRSVAEALAVGHQPDAQLSPDDEALFRAFQTNLLSLISHELRTPLTGILNSLGLLESGEAEGFSQAELISMARRNAQRLNETLSSLLDLAAMESRTFHARLREVDLARLIHARLKPCVSKFRDRGLELEIKEETGSLTAVPVLADPQKLGRAIELCFQSIAPLARTKSAVELRITSSRLSFEFEIEEAQIDYWQTAWSQAVAGFHGGIASPGSAFAGTLQSESGFLTRFNEGLGSELLLIHEIMRLHHGKIGHEQQGLCARFWLELPAVSSEEGLKMVLASRIALVAPEYGAIGSVVLGLIDVPEGMDQMAFHAEVKNHLFRASDAVYALSARRRVALVMDDCKAEDAPRVMERIVETVSRSMPVRRYGYASSPAEGIDAARLIETAEQRLSGVAP